MLLLGTSPAGPSNSLTPNVLITPALALEQLGIHNSISQALLLLGFKFGPKKHLSTRDLESTQSWLPDKAIEDSLSNHQHSPESKGSLHKMKYEEIRGLDPLPTQQSVKFLRGRSDPCLYY